ncbi:aminoglycoside phosphotransferase family protein [Hahella sp. HN01]|uniref:aminoglycoside phosphotransferase family protein n=1 Tax=Hahella sp. HN01 TaxID=2847262 RepID=UPI001C1EF368|nr:phosphotransferase [Hahella sp. HN01]MBU6952818.1 phosphotransferase [Hahella sp. HN01]
MTQRPDLIRHWLATYFGDDQFDVSFLSGDASFRRYFRVTREQRVFVLMDAPPAQEDCRPFIAISRSWRAKGIRVPEIYAENLKDGFLLLEDFGDHLFGNAIADAPALQVDQLYRQAIDALLPIQKAADIEGYALPSYDEAMLRFEMSIFREWLLEKKLGFNLDPTETEYLDHCMNRLVESALEQPVVVTHRDYHSRNLLVSEQGDLGIIDFQGAVKGPLAYDLASLLRDCYVKWPSEKVEAWSRYYYDQVDPALLNGADFATFTRWFDWIGVQRHLKAAGLFARLSLRDGKHGYLADIPRTLNYIIEVASKYDEFTEINEWIQERLVPAVRLLESNPEVVLCAQ